MQDNYPTTEDVKNAFPPGLTVPDGLERYLSSAIAKWKEMTGYPVFLGETSDFVARYNPAGPDGILDLKGGFWEVSEVRYGVIGASAGTVITLGTDYDLLPRNPEHEGQGWNEIQFYVAFLRVQPCPMMYRGTIQITGKRGWGRQLPDDAWLAIRDEAAAEAYWQTVNPDGRLKKIKQGPVETELDVTDNWAREGCMKFDSAVTRYGRKGGM